MTYIFSLCLRHARSVYRTSLSVVELIAMYKAVSSAKSLATACFRLSKKVLYPSMSVSSDAIMVGFKEELFMSNFIKTIISVQKNKVSLFAHLHVLASSSN